MENKNESVRESFSKRKKFEQLEINVNHATNGTIMTQNSMGVLKVPKEINFHPSKAEDDLCELIVNTHC